MFSFYLFNFSVQLEIVNSAFILNSSHPWFYSLSVDVWLPKSYPHFAYHLNIVRDNLTANSLRWIHHILFCNKSMVFFVSHKQVQKKQFSISFILESLLPALFLVLIYLLVTVHYWRQDTSFYSNKTKIIFKCLYLMNFYIISKIK